MIQEGVSELIHHEEMEVPLFSRRSEASADACDVV